MKLSVLRVVLLYHSHSVRLGPSHVSHRQPLETVWSQYLQATPISHSCHATNSKMALEGLQYCTEMWQFYVEMKKFLPTAGTYESKWILAMQRQRPHHEWCNKFWMQKIRLRWEWVKWNNGHSSLSVTECNHRHEEDLDATAQEQRQQHAIAWWTKHITMNQLPTKLLLSVFL